MKQPSSILKPLLFLSLITITTLARHAITIGPNRGRMGNWLMAYIKAKYMAHESGYPFIYKPFFNSNLFMLHELETPYTKKNSAPYKRKLEIWGIDRFIADQNQKKPTLYTARLATTMRKKRQPLTYSKEFRDEIRRMITSRTPLTLITPPDNCTSVAIHVRTGGTAVHIHTMQGRSIRTQDKTATRPSKTKTVPDHTLKKDHPLKFPSNNFYINALCALCEKLPKDALYCFVFTDDENPQKIINDIKKRVPNKRITFAYREQNNAHDKTILEDFFSMAQFDCLIRPESTYSVIAELIGNHKIVISPRSGGGKYALRQRSENDTLRPISLYL